MQPHPSCVLSPVCFDASQGMHTPDRLPQQVTVSPDTIVGVARQLAQPAALRQITIPKTGTQRCPVPRTIQPPGSLCHRAAARHFQKRGHTQLRQPIATAMAAGLFQIHSLPERSTTEQGRADVRHPCPLLQSCAVWPPRFDSGRL